MSKMKNKNTTKEIVNKSSKAKKTSTIKKVSTEKVKKESSKKNKKHSIKNKIKNDQTVKLHNHQLIQLKMAKQSLINEFSQILEKFNDEASSIATREDLLEKLPIETLQQLHNSSLPINPDLSVTQFLDKRISMRKELEEQDAKMKDIDHKIAITQIDLIQAKIAAIISSLD